MEPIEKLLNEIIKSLIPSVNSSIGGIIRNQGLDPMKNVYSGSDNLGRINLGICHASANLSYSLENLVGLSSIEIDSLTISSITTANDGQTVHGKIHLDAHLKSNISIHAGGKIRAGCGFIHDSVGVSGNITGSSVTVSANGDFAASLGSEVCLNDLDITNPQVDYSNLTVNFDGLGIFNSLLHPLESLILDLVKGPIRNLIGNQIASPINKALNEALPQCKKIV